MIKKLIISTVLLSVLLVDLSSQECVCNVWRSGEYCGTELNRINGNSDCERSIYFCGPGNRNRTAMMLKSCPSGRECDIRIRGRNACLRSIECRCNRGLGRGPYCGSQLSGSDCSADMVFMCRRIGRPHPREACLNGCSEGRCNPGSGSAPRRPSTESSVTDNPDSVAVTEGEREQQQSTNANTTQSSIDP